MFKIYLLSLVLVLICLINEANSVDRNNFKTCSQSGFCKYYIKNFLLNSNLLINSFIQRRQRNYKPDVSPYVVKFDTLKLEKGHVSAHVVNTKNSILFSLDLYLLKDSRFRFRFNELNPLKTRYEVKDVIIDDLEQEKYLYIYFIEKKF